MPCGRIVARTLARPNQDLEAVARAYDAPFVGVESKAGARRFPWCIPFAQPLEGLAAEQARALAVIDRFPAPVHFAFGDADPVFAFDWAERWAKRTPGSTLDRVAGASHFVQEEAGEELAEILLRRAARLAVLLLGRRRPEDGRLPARSRTGFRFSSIQPM